MKHKKVDGKFLSTGRWKISVNFGRRIKSGSSCRVIQPPLLPPAGLQDGWGWRAPPSCSVLREWILEVREVKSEMKIGFTHFEKWKVKWKSVSLISRMKSKMKMPQDRDREWKVKWKCLEIEKWSFSRIVEKFLRIKSEMKMPRDRDRE